MESHHSLACLSARSWHAPSAVDPHSERSANSSTPCQMARALSDCCNRSFRGCSDRRAERSVEDLCLRTQCGGGEELFNHQRSGCELDTRCREGRQGLIGRLARAEFLLSPSTAIAVSTAGACRAYRRACLRLVPALQVLGRLFAWRVAIRPHTSPKMPAFAPKRAQLPPGRAPAVVRS